jgi:hypothetical protein
MLMKHDPQCDRSFYLEFPLRRDTAARLRNGDPVLWTLLPRSLLVQGIRSSDAFRKRPSSSRGPQVAVSEGGVSVYGRSVHAYAYIRMRLQVESLDFRYTRSVPAPPGMSNVG